MVIFDGYGEGTAWIRRVVKLATTEDTGPDASSNSTWASGQPFDTRMACQFGILSLPVILRIPF